MSDPDLWNDFQQSFLVKLNSADFKQTFENRQNTITSGSTPSLTVTTGFLNDYNDPNGNHITGRGTGGTIGGVGRTFQRRRSKTGEELREQVDKAVIPSPNPMSPKRGRARERGRGKSECRGMG